MFAPKFCTFWYPYRLVETLKRQFPGLSIFSPIFRDRHLRLYRQPPQGSPSPSVQAAPSRDRHLWPSKSSVRGFGYDYGYGYVKSVDSMDNVNSVRSADNVNSMDNVDDSAPFIPAAPPRRRITALLALLALSMLLTLSALRTLLTSSMLSTLLT